MGSLLGVKLGCLVALALLPLLGGLLPATILRLRGSLRTGLSESGQSIVTCAAGGVFLGACLLDVIPDSLADLRDEMSRRSLLSDFPMPELILALGFLLVLVMEHVILDCTEQHGDEASFPLLPRASHPEANTSQCDLDTEAPSPFRSLVLTVSLSLHSVFEGLAIGLQDTEAKVLQLAVAILLHKTVIALSLALLLLQSRLLFRWVAACLVTFALMCPLGMSVGMVMTHSPEAGSSAARSVLEGIAAGTFMYITFLEILPQELHTPASRLPKVLAVLLGFSGMAALRFLG
ncbi:zinc transporter ZIP1 [Pogona vitticeps]